MPAGYCLGNSLVVSDGGDRRSGGKIGNLKTVEYRRRSQKKTREARSHVHDPGLLASIGGVAGGLVAALYDEHSALYDRPHGTVLASRLGLGSAACPSRRVRIVPS